jgi:DNA polymerase III delta subunit
VGTLSPAAVRTQIESLKTDAIYLVQGEDEVEKSALAGQFAELVEEDLRAFNVERIHASDVAGGDRIAETVAAVLDAARTLPMMAPRRIVLVFQAENLLAPKRESETAMRALDGLVALLEQPEPHATLVFVATALDKRTKVFKLFAKYATVVECGAPEDVAAAERWAHQRVANAGVELDRAGARALAVHAGFPDRPRGDGKTGDIQVLRGDVDRLLLYALGQKRISADDVREVVGPAALQDQWAMSNAVEAGQVGEALRQLALLLDSGAAPPLVLGQLGAVVRSKFPAAAPNDLRPAVEALFRTDQDLKRSGGDPRILLERLVVELCAGKRVARRW